MNHNLDGVYLAYDNVISVAYDEELNNIKGLINRL